MALAMIEEAEARGDLRPGMTVVEYTGGSTGSSLAFVCAVKGYPFKVVSSDAFAREKLQTMRAFGADVLVVPSVERDHHPGPDPEDAGRGAKTRRPHRAPTGRTSSTTGTRSSGTPASAANWRSRSTGPLTCSAAAWAWAACWLGWDRR